MIRAGCSSGWEDLLLKVSCYVSSEFLMCRSFFWQLTCLVLPHEQCILLQPNSIWRADSTLGTCSLVESILHLEPIEVWFPINFLKTDSVLCFETDLCFQLFLRLLKNSYINPLSQLFRNLFSFWNCNYTSIVIIMPSLMTLLLSIDWWIHFIMFEACLWFYARELYLVSILEFR